MIPWRDYSFLSDEDDLALLDELDNANEEPVTAKQFYEHSGYNSPRPAVHYFNMFAHDGSVKNHVLLFGLDIGLFLTTTGLFIIYNQPSIYILCVSLAVFGILNISLQVHCNKTILKVFTFRLFFNPILSGVGR